MSIEDQIKELKASKKRAKKQAKKFLRLSKLYDKLIKNIET